MGFRINTGSGIDPKLVDKLMELEYQPVKMIENRVKGVEEEQKEFNELKGLISKFGTALTGFRTQGDFFKVKLDSSHPDIIDGSVDNRTPIGTYELQVLKLAKTHKMLAESFPDKNETPVGFGLMAIEIEDEGVVEIEVDPDSNTLLEVANAINSAKAGVKAVIINTKENIEHLDEENYRLLVISEKSGKQGKVWIDPDTTMLDFNEQVSGRNLEMLFEDVPVYNEDNNVTELIEGLTLNAKKAAPGTVVTISTDYDIDETLGNIQELINAYNDVNNFLQDQFTVDPKTNRAGILSKDNSLKTLRRNLQSALQCVHEGGKYRTLADIGITTDAKTGALNFDESKAREALADDYLSVSQLFVQSEDFDGVGVRLTNTVRDLQSADHGILSSKDREYRKILASFENDIATKERLAEQRAAGIKRKFAAVESLISGLNTQGQFLAQKLGMGAQGSNQQNKSS